jgi:hypothetical protein
MRRRRRNPRIPPYMVQLAVYGGVAFLLYKFGSGLLDKFRGAISGPADAFAKWRVGAPMQIASGVAYLLPNGSIVPASMTVPDGGAYILYLNTRYKIVAATPPGSGNYTVEKA